MADANRISLLSHAAMTTPGSITNHVVDASNEGFAFVFQPGITDPITHLGYRYGARTGTPPTYSMRLESVDGSGVPDNTDVGGGSATAVTFTPPADTSIDGLWQWMTLTNSYTPTSRGQLLAGVIRYSSGTIDGSNNSSFSRQFATHFSTTGFPYHCTNTGGTWTKQTSGILGGWRTASGRYGYIGQSAFATNTAATSGHQSGMYFTLPSGHGDTFKVLGVRGPITLGPGGGSAKIVLTASDGTVLQDITIDSDHVAGGALQVSAFFFDESTLSTLSYGTKYYIMLESTGSAVGTRGIVLAESEDREAYPNGLNRGLVTYNGSSYTESDLTLPFLDLILADITEPAGGSGGALLLGGLGQTGIGVF